MIALSVRFVILIALVAGGVAQPPIGSAAEAGLAASMTFSIVDGGACGGDGAAEDACFAACVGGCAMLAAVTTNLDTGSPARWIIDWRRAFGITSPPLPTPPRL